MSEKRRVIRTQWQRAAVTQTGDAPGLKTKAYAWFASPGCFPGTAINFQEEVTKYIFKCSRVET